MTNIVVLNHMNHRCLRVDTRASADDRQRFVPVVINEFPFLVAHCPILMSKDADTGAFFCGAMLGFDEGENLLSGAGDSYRPLNLRRMPFYTAGSELAIDLDSPCVGTEDGQALFAEDGKPSDYLKTIMAVFRELVPGLDATNVFIKTLLEAKLVEPIDVDLGFDDGTKRQLRGLYTVDQDALRNLPDAKVLELFRKGYLHLMYLMIASLRQIPVLAQKKNGRLLQASEALAAGR